MRNEIDKPSDNSPLEQWLKKHARGTVEQYRKLESSGDFKRKLTFASAQQDQGDFEAFIDPNDEFQASDKFSQINTLEQLKQFLSYPFLRERLHRKELQVQALWTDLSKGEVYIFSFEAKTFVKIDESSYETLSQQCETSQ